MGINKKNNLNNPRKFAKIKLYSFYRRDMWGSLVWKKQYRFKKAIYNMLRVKRRFYYIIMNQVYGGRKYWVKRFSRIGNLFVLKERLRYFYNNLKRHQFAKLMVLAKKKSGDLVNNFFSLIERRLDVVLVRANFVSTMRKSRFLVVNGVVLINGKVISYISYKLLVASFVFVFYKREFLGRFFCRCFYNNSSIFNYFGFIKMFQNFVYFFFKFFFFYKFFNVVDYNFNLLNFSNKVIKKVNSEIVKKSLFLYKFFLLKKKFEVNYSEYGYVFLNFFRIGKFFVRNFFYLFFKYKVFISYRLFMFKFDVISYDELFARIFFLQKLLFSKFLKRYKFVKILNKVKYNRFLFLKNEKKNILKKKFIKLSKVSFYFLKNKFYKIRKYCPVKFGYPSYLEVNYKISSFIVVEFPLLKSVLYPFGVDHLQILEAYRRGSFFQFLLSFV